MADIIRRREALVKSSAGPTPPGALYQLKQGAFFAGVVSGNTIYMATSGSSNAQANSTEITSSVSSGIWFQLYSGDSMTMKIKNITGVNRRTSGKARMTVVFKGTNAADLIGPTITAELAQGATTTADIERTVILSDDKDVYYVNMNLSGPAEMTFDLELWINGIRYL